MFERTKDTVLDRQFGLMTVNILTGTSSLAKLDSLLADFLET